MSDITEDLYHEALIEEAKVPSNYGEMVDAHLVLHGSNASCGDVVTLYFKFSNQDDHHSPIEKFSWTGSGCVISRAGASVFSRLVTTQGLSLKKAAEISQPVLEKELGLHNISVNRIKCVLLSVNTLKQQL